MIAFITVEQSAMLSLALMACCAVIHLARAKDAQLTRMQKMNPALGGAIFALLLPSLTHDAASSSSDAFRSVILMVYLGGWMITLWAGTIALRLVISRLRKNP